MYKVLVIMSDTAKFTVASLPDAQHVRDRTGLVVLRVYDIYLGEILASGLVQTNH